MADMGTPRTTANASGANLLVSNAQDYANTARARVATAKGYVAGTKEALAACVKDYAEARVELAAADVILEAAKAAAHPADVSKWKHYAYVGASVLVAVVIAAVVLHFVW